MPAQPQIMLPSAPSLRRPSRLGVVAGLWLVLAVVVAYLNTLSVPFFFDDLSAIDENPTIRQWWRLDQVLSPPSDGSAVTGRPLLNFTFAVNYAISGRSPVSYHLGNIALHSGAALMLFGVVGLTLVRGLSTGVPDRQTTFTAFFVALLWAVHPLQTESVTCVAQRTELLVGFFYLLTLYCFLRSTEGKHPVGWSVASVFACLLGMASKEVMVSAPLVVFLFDRTFVAGSFSQAWRRRRGYYVALGSTWLLLFALVAGAGGSRGSAAGFGLGVSSWAYLLKQCEAIVLYLRLSLWPHPLVVDYGTDVVHRLLPVLPQACLVVTLFGGTLLALWKRPWLGFLGIWFFAILSPSSSFIPLVSQTMAEHRMYLPLAALTTLGVLGVRTFLRRGSLSILSAVAVGFVVISIWRNRDYRSDLSIWEVTVAQRPGNGRAQSNLADAYKARGRLREAATGYAEALRLDPNQPETLNNWGLVLLDQGRTAEAVATFERTLVLKPNFADAMTNLGNAMTKAGRADEALRWFEGAVRAKPHLVPALSNLAGALVQAGRYPEAMVHAKRALELKPDYVLARSNLAVALLRGGRTAEAVPQYEILLKAHPGDGSAHNNLGSAYYILDRAQEAIPHYEQAVTLDPQNGSYRNNLAGALFRVGRKEAAVEQYRASLRLAPEDLETRANLALVLAQLDRPHEAVVEYEGVLSRDPNHGMAHFGLGQSLYALQRRTEAMEHLATAVRLLPAFEPARVLFDRVREVESAPPQP